MCGQADRSRKHWFQSSTNLLALNAFLKRYTTSRSYQSTQTRIIDMLMATHGYSWQLQQHMRTRTESEAFLLRIGSMFDVLYDFKLGLRLTNLRTYELLTTNGKPVFQSVRPNRSAVFDMSRWMAAKSSGHPISAYLIMIRSKTWSSSSSNIRRDSKLMFFALKSITAAALTCASSVSASLSR